MKKSDKTILKSLKNPSYWKYEIKSICPEVTFIGHKNTNSKEEQPDFAEIHVTMIPDRKIIELKSLKLYFQHFRNVLISYEHLLNIVYEDIMEIYEPFYLEIYIKTNPRGGIYSELVRSSD